jgi:hypothetical protein
MVKQTEQKRDRKTDGKQREKKKMFGKADIERWG